MKTQIILLMGVVLFIYISCKKDEPVSQPQQQTDPRIAEVKQKLQGRWIGYKWVHDYNTSTLYVNDSCNCSFDWIFKGDSLFVYIADTLKAQVFAVYEVIENPQCSDKDHVIALRSYGGLIEFLEPDTLYLNDCSIDGGSERWFKKDTTYNN